MRYTLLFSVLFGRIGGQISHIPGQSCHSSITAPQVVGGEDTSSERVPWNAVIELRRNQNSDRIKTNCGGSVISKRVILTAGHCVWSNDYGCPQNIRNKKSANYCHELPNGCPSGCFRARPQDLNVYVGITSITQTERIPRPIQKIIVHNLWTKSSSITEIIRDGNDLALVVLVNELEFVPKIRPICIPNHQLRLQSDAYVEINGFGYTDANTKTLAERLQTGSMRIKDKDECNAEYEAFSTRTSESTIRGDQVCAYGNGTDSCKGDSGSGLVKFVDSVPILVGIVSFGHKYCRDLPGVYTNIQTHVEWILQKLDMINSEILQTFQRCSENETCEAKATCTYIQQKYREAKEAREAGSRTQRRNIINKLKSIICNKEKKAFCCPAQ